MIKIPNIQIYVDIPIMIDQLAEIWSETFIV